MENDKNTSEKKGVLGLPISETVLLAAATFLAYVFTFTYQAGYVDAFGLPRQFITMTLTDVINIGGLCSPWRLALLSFVRSDVVTESTFAEVIV